MCSLIHENKLDKYKRDIFVWFDKMKEERNVIVF